MEDSKMLNAKELFSDSLTEVNMEKMDKLLKYLKKNNIKKYSNKPLNIFSIDGKEQLNNSYVIYSYLKTNDLKISEENILIGNKYLQQVFYPMEILSDSKKSSSGMIALTGLKGSEKFIIVKYPIFNNPYPILKELAIGLKMNELRLKIPNIMYTYGGLYCSSPVNMDYVYTKVEKKLEEKFIFMMIKLLVDINLVEINNEDSFKEYRRLFRDIGEEVSQKIMLSIKITDKMFISKVFNNIKRIISEEYELIHEITDKKVKDIRLENLKIYEIILENINTNYNLRNSLINIKNIMYKNYEDQIKDKVKDFDFSLFCNNSVLSTLLLAEYIPNSLDIEVAWSVMNEREQIDIVCQLIFFLNMAWQFCKFTHNDLHEKNIMVRKLNEIEIEYDVVVSDKGDKEQIKIKTEQVAFIIDLGDASITDNEYEIGDTQSNFIEILSVLEIVLFLNEDKDNKISKLKKIYNKYNEYKYDNIKFNYEIYKDIVDWYRM